MLNMTRSPPLLVSSFSSASSGSSLVARPSGCQLSSSAAADHPRTAQGKPGPNSFHNSRDRTSLGCDCEADEPGVDPRGDEVV